MNWFKHKADTHEDYKMSDAIKKYGHLAYKFYFILIEVYAKYYNEHDEEYYVKISKEKLAKINNIYPRNIEKLLKYFKENEKILYVIDNEIILFKINDFKKLHNRWCNEKEKKKKTKCVIEVEEEVEKEVEVENLTAQAEEVLKFFNEATGKNYTDTRYILPLLKKGKKYEDFCVVIMNKLDDTFFKENPKLITPKTLFKEEVFDIYLNEGIEIKEKKNVL